MSTLPGRAGEIEQVIGLEATVRLLRWRGGCAIELPVHPERSELARRIGLDDARALVAYFGPGRLLLPMASARGQGFRRAQAIALLRAGKSVTEVALECDLHSRTVIRLKGGIEAEDQPELPFDR